MSKQLARQLLQEPKVAGADKPYLAKTMTVSRFALKISEVGLMNVLEIREKAKQIAENE